jgi:hypothetical protein
MGQTMWWGFRQWRIRCAGNHLLMLLSGSRPTALKKLRMQYVDLRGRTIHSQRPKGGEEKAFDIPLSRLL